ncbi:MAG: DUF2905 domain-containing protein [Dehalococcoidia bacterium]
MTARSLGLAIAVAGLVVVAIGGLVALGALSWFGRLPGDLRFESADGRVRLFAPLASMLVVSLILTFVVNLLRRWLD